MQSPPQQPPPLLQKEGANANLGISQDSQCLEKHQD